MRHAWLGRLSPAWHGARMGRLTLKRVLAAAEREALRPAIKPPTDPRSRDRVQTVQRAARHGIERAANSRYCWLGKVGGALQVPRPHRYEPAYVYGAVEGAEGQSPFRRLPSVSLDLSWGFLLQIADSDPKAEHVIIRDQAGFHPSPERPALPARIHLLPLPPASPERNPVEGLWDQLRDALGHRRFATLEALEAAVIGALRPLRECRDEVVALVFDGVRDHANASS